MTRAVLFDLDGVLIHSAGAWFCLLAALADRLGHPPVERTAFERSFGQGVEADIAEFFPGESRERVSSLYDRHFLDHVDQVEVDPSATSVMVGLRTAGIRVAVVTNTPPLLAREICQRLELPADRIYGPGGEVREKPAPDMLLKALVAFGVQPEHAVMIGDSRFDREAAAAAGVRFVGLRIDGDERIEKLQHLLS